MEGQDMHLPLTNDSSQVSDGLPSQEFAPSDPNLCNVCNFILQNEVELSQDCENPHQSNLFELERAAQDGCHLCRLILSSIKPAKLQKLRVHHDRVQRWLKAEAKAREGLVSYRISQRPHGFEINFRGRLSEESPWETSKRFIFFTVGYFSSALIEVEDSYEVVHDLPPSINDQTWALVGDWLQPCLTSHVKCNRSQNLEAWLPSRLLDVGEADSPLEPRLCSSVELPRDSRYIALSHCWGQLQILRLLEGNLESFKLSIPWHQLSRTFQDAIQITRHFGLRYLWIDSLCIIQDSLADWEQESAMMGRVYERCWLNIAASAASDGSGGFFAKRDTTSSGLEPLKAQFSWLGQRQGTYLLLPPNFKTRVLKNEPLGRRAWVYQERQLSPRTLHFTTRQIFWECCERDACEMLPSGLPLIAENSWKSLEEEDGAVDYVAPTVDPDPRLNSYNLWDRVVHAYIFGNLTVNSDKLIAVAGVAKRLQPLLHSEYLAGLWREYLEYQLLWHVGNYKEPVRPEPYRAPSWSWASVNGNIFSACKVYLYDKSDLICEIIDVQVNCVGDPILGNVCDRFLRIKGRLMLCEVRRQPRGEYEKNQEWLDLYIFGMENSSSIKFDVDSPHLGTDLHFMPIQMDHDSEIGYVRGIILEPTKQKKGEFRRFGQVNIFRRRRDFHSFKEKSDPEKMNFEEFDGVDRFTITII